MQNYIKTILSAFKTWTQKKIKDSTADWNENDSSKSSYIKNRTHWEEQDGTIHKLDKKYLDLPTNLATTDDVQEAVDLANEAQNTANTAVANAATAQSTADTKMDKNNPTGTGSFSMNRKANTTIGPYSHAEGYNNTASGWNSHAEGEYNVASESDAHAEGLQTTASGVASHAEGSGTTASGAHSHAEGEGTVAGGKGSHAGGMYNISDTSTIDRKTGRRKYTHIIGNGTSDTTRSNAHTLDWEGNAWYSGDVYVGSTSGTNRDEGSKKLATEDFVISQLENLSSLNRKIVEILPDISEADPNIIYMVPKSASLVSNVYDEYMFIEEAWELIGSTAVDLSDYVTKGELTNALDDYATKDELADKNSDWAKNDAEQPGYVENRTHYVQDTLDRYSAHFEDGFPEDIFWTISLTKEQAQGIYDSWETAVEWISPYGGLVSLSNLDTETIDNGRTKVVIIPDYQVELRISPEEKKLYSSSNQGGILLKSPVEQIKYLDAKYVEDMYSTKLIRDNTIYESSAYSDSSVSNYSYGYFEGRELAEILLKDFNGVKYYINGHECYYMGQPSSHLCQFYYVDECEVVFSVELKTNKVDREYVINGEIYITGTSVSDSAFEHLLNVQECKIYVAKEEKVNKIPKKYLPDECLLKEEFTLARLGVTATATELNYVDGVKSSIQSQLNSKMQANNPVYSGIIVHQLSQNLEPGSDSVTFSVGGIASGPNAFAEGASTQAYGAASHSEGNNTIARGQASHAEGYRTKVKADSKGGHAEGIFTIATAPGQHVQGSANVEDEDQIYAHIVGNGSDEENRSNAYALDWQGNGWFAGDVYVGSTSGIDKDEGSKKLATEDLVAQKTQVQIITWGADD